MVQQDFSETKLNETATENIGVTTPTGTEIPSKEDVPQIFVGNLSLRTKERGLVTLFGPIGQILGIQIITVRQHGRRHSACYGFITFATMEQVLNAIKTLNKRVLDGREIQVQVARSKPRITANTDPETSTASGNVKSDAAPRPSKQSNGRALGLRNKKHETAQGEDGDFKKNSNIAQLDGATIGSGETVTSRTIPNKTLRLPAAKKPMTKTSQTTIFVANLPDSATDDTLMDIFKNYEVVSVRVVRPPNRSRGYGFVDLSSEHEREMAMKSIQHVELKGRLIHLKVARSQSNFSETTIDDPESSGTMRQATDSVKERDRSGKN
ncbi:hypothetical protein BCR42DRAFT_493312 [Absidia repens]|uniref:RRM domain-containing protein n=1 Tax=Absidia repens TaxID=90262 RepID=A0A1X2IBF0_9FUNG|nr:hypothetical protein BCR42DRAFT_493312 [Absidia repens]